MFSKKLWLFALYILFSTPSYAQYDGIKLKNGDLLFQDIDCGPLCDAIEGVTDGFNGKDFSHIGLFYTKQDSLYIIEAIGDKVCLTPLDKFLTRTPNKIYIGRLKPKYSKLNKRAVSFALEQVDKPYDDAFLYNNGKYYCSELLYDAFLHANHKKPFFTLEPMTFRQPGTDTYYPAWVDYYEKLGIDIPEGKPGINPGGISKSPYIIILNP